MVGFDIVKISVPKISWFYLSHLEVRSHPNPSPMSPTVVGQGLPANRQPIAPPATPSATNPEYCCSTDRRFPLKLNQSLYKK